jgi:hypothetical protein
VLPAVTFDPVTPKPLMLNNNKHVLPCYQTFLIIVREEEEEEEGDICIGDMRKNLVTR